MPMIAPAPAAAFTLSTAEREHFDRQGWVGSWPLLEPAQAEQLLLAQRRVDSRLVQPDHIAQYPQRAAQGQVWFKSLHEVSPEFFDIAHDPRIVGRVAALLGPDVLLWGVSTKRMLPGRAHEWHIDVEHRRWRGVSVYVGLRNLTPRNSLMLVTGTQNLLQTPSEARCANDREVLEYCAARIPGAQIQLVFPGSHGFFIFDGPIWHGALNRETFDREIMILQYCAADQQPRVPINWTAPVQWHGQPACALVSGKDLNGRNRIISRPQVP